MHIELALFIALSFSCTQVTKVAFIAFLGLLRNGSFILIVSLDGVMLKIIVQLAIAERIFISFSLDIEPI